MVDQVVNEGKTVAIRNKYSDLDLLFGVHPLTGDVAKRTDTDAIKRSVRNIVECNKYERPFKPNFGCSLRDRLFELDSDRKINRVKRDIINQIEVFEPRVTNVKVDLKTQDNSLYVTVYYTIQNGYKTDKVSLNVRRVR